MLVKGAPVVELDKNGLNTNYAVQENIYGLIYLNKE